MAPSSKSLTVGMATYDDFDGAYFTIQSIRLYHPEVVDRLDFLLVDNNPGGPHSTALEALQRAVPGLRYVANQEILGTAVRDFVFRLATTPYVLCLDSHVLVAPGALGRMIDYFDARPDCNDLLQGPLVADDLGSISTHFDPVWRAGMYGVWATDERGRDPEAAPFEIPMQGLGLFACRRDVWPGLNPRFSGFGGEEGYLHEKFRRRGGRCLCLPFLRWVHRFQRPGGPSYKVSWQDRIRNYLIGLDELGASDEDAVAHFRELLGRESADAIVDEVRRELAGLSYPLDTLGKRPESPGEDPGEGLEPDLEPSKTAPLRLCRDADIAILDDSVLVYSMGAGPAVSLNPTAGVIVRLIDGERGKEEIVEILQALYPDSAEQLPSEVEKVLGFLRASGLLAPFAASDA
ncbi:MAG: PqqD family peptide modification chaperone [Acidobacteriota bacterium]